MIQTGRRLVVVAALLLFGQIAPVGAQPCVAPPTGVVGWWTGNGTALDSALGNNGQLFGNATFAPAVVNQGFKLDGVGDYFEIADSLELKPVHVSVEAWVRLDSLITSEGFPGLQFIVFKRNTRQFNFEAYALRKHLDNGVPRFVFSIGDITGFATLSMAMSVTPIVVGQFYHLVGTYDGSHVRLYVNGALEGERPETRAIDYGTRPVYIGTSGDPFDGKLNGIVDEPTIYNRALDPSEVAALHAAGTGGKCASVTGQVTSLVNYVQSLNVAAGIANSFDAKLRTALEALDDANAGQTRSACNRLQAFVNEVAAQADRSLSAAQAAQLTQMASRIRLTLACK